MMLRAGIVAPATPYLPVLAGEGYSGKTRVSLLTGSPLSRFTVHAVAAGMILLLSACASNPPPPSGDTYCERARHISATDAQIAVFSANWEVMEAYADQIIAHNLTYDAACTKETK